MINPIKVIDFHVHTPFNAERKGVTAKEMADRVIEWMDDNRIYISVLLPIAPYISNEYIARVVDYYPDRLIGFASVIPSPADEAIKQLRLAVKDLDLRGLKLHPGVQGFCLNNPHTWKVLQVAGELEIPVVIDAMLGDFSTLYFKGPYTPWVNTVEDYALLPFIAPKTTLVLAHMGGSFNFEKILQIATAENVYMDTSYSILTIVNKIGIDTFTKYIKSLGASKFIYGSDYVFNLTPEDYGARKQIELINKMRLSPEEKNLILSKNALNILKS